MVIDGEGGVTQTVIWVELISVGAPQRLLIKLLVHL